MITSVSLKRTVQVAALTAVFAASGSGIALAGTSGHSSGNHSILGGNQISVPISIPVNVCGNAVAILGQALGICQGGASTGSGGSGGSTSGNGSIGGGNQISIPISVPVNVCGNSVGVLGSAASSCKGGSTTGRPPHHHHHSPPPRHHHSPPPHLPSSPPPAHHHHHHSGTGATVTPPNLPTAAVTGSSTLPTTGANFLGLLALAGGVTVSGAGSLLLITRRRLAHGVLAVTRRAVRTLAGAAMAR